MYKKITKELLDNVVAWVKENGLIDHGGATITALCDHFDISTRTFIRWRKNEDFQNAIDEAKQRFAEKLEKDLVQSLARAAKGYKSVRKKTSYIEGKDGTPKIKQMTTEEVEVPPNVGAAIFLLTNIAPERWQNKMQQQTDLQGALSLGVKILDKNIPDISTAEEDIDAKR